MNRRNFFAQVFGFGAAVVMNQFIKAAPLKPEFTAYKRVFTSETLVVGDMAILRENFAKAIVDCWEERDAYNYYK